MEENRKKIVVYATFGNALSWDAIKRKFKEFGLKMEQRYDMLELDYHKKCIDFDEELAKLEEKADLIFYDQTESSCGSARDKECYYGHRSKGNKWIITLTGNVNPDVILKLAENALGE